MFGSRKEKSIDAADLECPASQLRVLVVDDRVSSRSVVRPTLRALGIVDIDEALTAAQGLAMLRHPDGKDYDLVVCGSSGKAVDPLAFCNTVRRADSLRSKRIPILVLTGEEDRLLLDVVLSAGAAGVVNRPVSAPQLLERIERAVGICFDRVIRGGAPLNAAG
jgi:CheY-like chemotaxis protein